MGFRLAGASWRIVRSEPSLVAFPLLSAASAIAACAVMAALAMFSDRVSSASR